MEIRYQFFNDDHLLIQKFIGVFSVEDYLRHNGLITGRLMTSLVDRVLLDFRELQFSENNASMPDDFKEKMDEMVNIRRDINTRTHHNKSVDLVILVNSPLPTLIAHLFVSNFEGMKYHYCSSLSKAIEMLRIPEYSDRIESVIENLENIS